MSDRKALIVGGIIGLILVLCLCCLIALGGSAYWMRDIFLQVGEQGREINFDTDPDTQAAPTSAVPLVRPTETDTTDTPQLSFGGETLFALENTVVPENDLRDLAMRLLGVGDIPLTLPDQDAPHQVGEQMTFWVTDTSIDRPFQVDATLRKVTEHVYFWIDNKVSYSAGGLQNVADTFENQIYPTNQEFFGSEWSPGIDEDPHIYILYASNVGFGVAGYFSSSDETHPVIDEYSNAHEMFVINADNTPLEGDYILDVLAHEFQHMIHWNGDRNESLWVNEGFSELAVLLNGFYSSGFDYSFMADPDYQLNDWPNGDLHAENYGASFLFMAYFLDRLGEDATQMLVSHPENGLHSIDLVLGELDFNDPLRGTPFRADQLMLDWALTNYIMDGSVGDGRYTYNLYSNAPQALDTETFSDCDPDDYLRDVHQYATDYIRITCPGQHTLRFTGSIETSLLPTEVYSGNYAFWSNKGDESDMTLTRTFDFTGQSGPLTLNYWTWYDIETDYDYVYLLASTDGETWEILTTPSGTSDDPTGANYGFAYNDLSGGGSTSVWIQESVDLSKFAGQEVQIRFEYLTDAGVNGEGLLLDDVEIPEIGYFTDFETDEGGWEAYGFVRVANVLPQNFQLALISYGDETTVEYLSMGEDNTLEVDFEIGNGVDEVVLVVVGTTRYTRQLAAYQIEFLP